MTVSRLTELGILAFFLSALFSCDDPVDQPLTWSSGSFPSADGVPIAYQAAGEGPVSLVFVHGWTCDRSYWKEQLDHFAASQTVAAVDLAGHGDSGLGREEWTMGAFGEDVAAVVRGLGQERVLLIGHSMGAPVIAEAALRISDRVIGLVVADGFGDLDSATTPEQVEQLLVPFREDYAGTSRQYISGSMFVPESDTILTEWILDDMSSAPPEVGIEAGGNSLLWIPQRSVEAFAEIHVPVRAINSDMVPTNLEAAERFGMEVVLMSGVGHVVMMEDPETFNALLAEAIADFSDSGRDL